MLCVWNKDPEFLRVINGSDPDPEDITIKCTETKYLNSQYLKKLLVPRQKGR